MTAKIGHVEGLCPQCGKTLRRRRPFDCATCDCHKYCPICGQEMQPYTPDLSPAMYGPMRSDMAMGDTDKLADILYCCPGCRYYSSLKPVEVHLS